MKYKVTSKGKRPRTFKNFNSAVSYGMTLKNPKESDFIFVIEEKDFKAIEKYLGEAKRLPD